MASEGTRGPDWVGRGIGLAVFAGGIGLLALVFFWTNQLGAGIPPDLKKLEVGEMVRFGVTVARLLVSGLVASWIAGRGAQLYGAANRALSND